jgi:hypothetical protein
MHDPQTVAFTIKRPWPVFRRTPFMDSRFYWPPLLTIWHHDPESDGSDDSCGWSRPKLTKKQSSDLDFFAGCEARDPWVLRDRSKRPEHAADAEALLRGVILFVGDRLRANVTVDEATRWTIRLIHNPVDNLRSSLCFLPGWHTNFEHDSEDHRRAEAHALFCCVARFILRERRPWYRHPQWHVWHWSIQAHPLQAFKRWAFSRCSGCGQGFAYGYSPVTGNWNGTGPLWFRSEGGIYHDRCFPSKVRAEKV